MLKRKEIRKIAPRIYTSNFEESTAVIVKRNIFEIVGSLYPGAVLSHRSAFEFKPTVTGQLFVTYSYTKKIRLPGVTLNFLKGMGNLPDDSNTFGGLYIASRERAFLENLQVTKKSRPNSKCIERADIDEKLNDILRINGEDAINRVRDKAREISLGLDLRKEFIV
jgi:hypothetical protein